MSLSILVYKNRSLSEEDRAVIGSADPGTGEPLLREGDTAYDTFAAKVTWIGNLFGVAGLRCELELGAPEMTESIRGHVLFNATISGHAIAEPHDSSIATECSNLLNLLAEGRIHLSEDVREFPRGLERSGENRAR
jgi:hypothetical protein